MNAQDVVPFEIYIKQGEGGDADEGIILSTNKMVVPLDDTVRITFYNWADFTNATVATDNTTIIDDLAIDEDVISFTTPSNVSGSGTITVTAYKGTKEYTAIVKVTLYVEGA
jgi:hypothetical protein